MLEVSEVGPAEYPLIAVLHATIFGGGGRLGLSQDEVGRDALILIAHLEGNPVGYLVGRGEAESSVFVVESTGVLSDYRREGMAARMMRWAEDHAKARGYESVRVVEGSAEGEAT